MTVSWFFNDPAMCFCHALIIVESRPGEIGCVSDDGRREWGVNLILLHANELFSDPCGQYGIFVTDQRL